MDAQHNIKLYYDNLASEYDDDRFDNTYGKYIDRQEKKIILNLLRHSSKSETLDMACGTGRFLEFADYGADISSSMLKEAQKKYPDKKLRECSALNSDFNNEQFSTILSFHFVMHLNKKTTSEFITEAHRILRREGRLIFDFPSEYRRQLIGYKNESWHAANSMTADTIKELSKDMFTIKQSYGVLFFPIHRLPKSIRGLFCWLDLSLCHSFLRKYASYTIVVLEKK